MYANHTPVNFCVIIEKWLKEQGFDRLIVIHQDISGTPWCNISAYDAAQNGRDVGWIRPDHLVLFSNAEPEWDEIYAYDKQIFEKLAKGLEYAKP